MIRNPITILMADDDPDDRMLAAEALEESMLANNFYFVEDGVELMDYLNRRGTFSDPEKSPRPGVILLDLNMPRKDGREALKEIKNDPKLKRIPVVVMTTSQVEQVALKPSLKDSSSISTGGTRDKEKGSSTTMDDGDGDEGDCDVENPSTSKDDGQEAGGEL